MKKIISILILIAGLVIVFIYPKETLLDVLTVYSILCVIINLVLAPLTFLIFMIVDDEDEEERHMPRLGKFMLFTSAAWSLVWVGCVINGYFYTGLTGCISVMLSVLIYHANNAICDKNEKNKKRACE
jgi:amino acid transporter